MLVNFSLYGMFKVILYGVIIDFFYLFCFFWIKIMLRIGFVVKFGVKVSLLKKSGFF